MNFVFLLWRWSIYSKKRGRRIPTSFQLCSLTQYHSSFFTKRIPILLVAWIRCGRRSWSWLPWLVTNGAQSELPTLEGCTNAKTFSDSRSDQVDTRPARLVTPELTDGEASPPIKELPCHKASGICPKSPSGSLHPSCSTNEVHVLRPNNSNNGTNTTGRKLYINWSGHSPTEWRTSNCSLPLKRGTRDDKWKPMALEMSRIDLTSPKRSMNLCLCIGCPDKSMLKETTNFFTMIPLIYQQIAKTPKVY